ncbi:hypothetical protein RC99_10565 [Pectobacterium carotovorum subsp. carotovorum]|nr:hypothetical protein RC99_10565 [Pectobacterium carotovorum subsp. carotovorum]
MLDDGRGEWITVCCKEKSGTQSDLQKDDSSLDRLESLIRMLNIPCNISPGDFRKAIGKHDGK